MPHNQDTFNNDETCIHTKDLNCKQIKSDDGMNKYSHPFSSAECNCLPRPNFNGGLANPPLKSERERAVIPHCFMWI